MIMTTEYRSKTIDYVQASKLVALSNMAVFISILVLSTFHVIFQCHSESKRDFRLKSFE